MFHNLIAGNALEQRQRHAVDVRDGQESSGLGLPNEGVAADKIWRHGLARAETLDRPGNALEQAGKRFLKVHVAPVAKTIEAAIVAPPSRGDKRPSQADNGPPPVEGGHP